MFQGLVEGAYLYVLRKKENKGMKVGQVVKVSNPYVPQVPTYPNATVIDVVAIFGGEEETIKGLPSLETISEDKNGVVISDNKDAMQAHVDAWYRISKQALELMPYHNEVVDVYDSIVRILNPEKEAERLREERLSNLEGRFDKMDGKLDHLMDYLMNNSKTKRNENN